MPSSDVYFKGWGAGIPAKSKSISARYPADVEKVLLEMSDRQSFIRAAVLEKMQREGLLER